MLPLSYTFTYYIAPFSAIFMRFPRIEVVFLRNEQKRIFSKLTFSIDKVNLLFTLILYNPAHETAHCGLRVVIKKFHLLSCDSHSLVVFGPIVSVCRYPSYPCICRMSEQITIGVCFGDNRTEQRQQFNEAPLIDICHNVNTRAALFTAGMSLRGGSCNQ